MEERGSLSLDEKEKGRVEDIGGRKKVSHWRGGKRGVWVGGRGEVGVFLFFSIRWGDREEGERENYAPL